MIICPGVMFPDRCLGLLCADRTLKTENHWKMCLKEHACKLTCMNEMCELSIEILISCQPPRKGSCLSQSVSDSGMSGDIMYSGILQLCEE